MTAALLFIAEREAAFAQGSPSIQPGVQLSFPTTANTTYQPQWSPAANGTWVNLGATVVGDGTTALLFDPLPNGARRYQVLAVVPAASATVVNGGFEIGTGAAPANWRTSSTALPVRISSDSHSGSFCMSCAITNTAATAKQGILDQHVAVEGGTVVAGQTYTFSFWTRQVSSGPSFVQQYQVQWLNSGNGVIGGTNLTTFAASNGTWTQVSVPNLVAPANAVDALIQFRVATGAVSNGSGQVLIDDVALDSATGRGAGVTSVLPVVSQPAVEISWPSTSGVKYQLESTTDLASGIWNDDIAPIAGDGAMQSIVAPMTNIAEFFRLLIMPPVVLPPPSLYTLPSGSADSVTLAWTSSPTPGVIGYRILYGDSSGSLTQSIDVGNVASATISGLVPGQTYYFAVIALTAAGQSPAGGATISAKPGTNSGIVPLFDASTILEPDTIITSPTSLITRIADRPRARHARESQFSLYGTYLPFYWEQRMTAIEIVDTIGRGGSTVTFNFSTLTQLSPSDFRIFFQGVSTVAAYSNNQRVTDLGSNQYTITIKTNSMFNRPLQAGDRMEFEFSPFMIAPTNGQKNYYGGAILYVAGQGIVPWQEGATGDPPSVNAALDSVPMPSSGWLGGGGTLPYQYSAEPQHAFNQLAPNASPLTGQAFLLGRRLHHTDFGNGSHSESSNPIFTEQIGKLGPGFTNRSCVACHVNNGRALPPAIGAPMLRSLVTVGSDANGTPDSILGSVLQPQSTTGQVLNGAVIASYTTTSGTYADGAPYTLQSPNYAFSGRKPAFYSVRLAPRLVGMGLLEAVSESTILAMAGPRTVGSTIISGQPQIVTDPQNKVPRLGRFTLRGGKARISHQIAAALNNDMGVTTSIYPVLNGASSAGLQEISDGDLANWTRYVSSLGLNARRNLTDPVALQGEQLFAAANCAACHAPTLVTSPYAPIAELRNQIIHPYTDLLLHDLGPGLADNMGEGVASGSQWRTAPLWSIGLSAGVSGGEAYLHDGRGSSLEEAILWHSGEAEASKQSFRAMSAADRAALIQFLKSL